MKAIVARIAVGSGVAAIATGCATGAGVGTSRADEAPAMSAQHDYAGLRAMMTELRAASQTAEPAVATVPDSGAATYSGIVSLTGEAATAQEMLGHIELEVDYVEGTLTGVMASFSSGEERGWSGSVPITGELQQSSFYLTGSGMVETTDGELPLSLKAAGGFAGEGASLLGGEIEGTGPAPGGQSDIALSGIIAAERE